LFFESALIKFKSLFTGLFRVVNPLKQSASPTILTKLTHTHFATSIHKNTPKKGKKQPFPQQNMHLEIYKEEYSCRFFYQRIILVRKNTPQHP
jgi:hypothetical protein